MPSWDAGWTGRPTCTRLNVAAARAQALALALALAIMVLANPYAEIGKRADWRSIEQLSSQILIFSSSWSYIRRESDREAPRLTNVRYAHKRPGSG